MASFQCFRFEFLRVWGVSFRSAFYLSASDKFVGFEGEHSCWQPQFQSSISAASLALTHFNHVYLVTGEGRCCRVVRLPDLLGCSNLHYLKPLEWLHTAGGSLRLVMILAFDSDNRSLILQGITCLTRAVDLNPALLLAGHGLAQRKHRVRYYVHLCNDWVSLGNHSLSLRWELEKEMATHSSILAWEIPWTEEPGRLQSMGSLRGRHDWAAKRKMRIMPIVFTCQFHCHAGEDSWESLVLQGDQSSQS